MTRLARLCSLLIPALILAGTGTARLSAQAAVTGKCKDGTTTSAKTKSGACRGHGGVAEWTGSAATPSAATTATTAAKPAKPAKPAKSKSIGKAVGESGSPPSAASSSAGIPCKDGTVSTSKSRSGACRGHGGIAKTSVGAMATSPAPATAPASRPTPAAAAPVPAAPAPTPAQAAAPARAPAPAAPKPAAAAAAPAGPAPEGATAVCKDGTYSKAKHHSGACAHHGGVSQWLGGN
jgi:hypothetical protein